MAPAMQKLERLMNQNLKSLSIKAAVGGLLGGVIGAMAGITFQLDTWRDQLQNFNEDTFEPARAAAAEKCKKEVGL